uniref:Uncharacterized protein n=2 Tax=Rhizophagus irregularis TaxID=588596 RepID=U9TV93_RHIID
MIQKTEYMLVNDMDIIIQVKKGFTKSKHYVSPIQPSQKSKHAKETYFNMENVSPKLSVMMKVEDNIPLRTNQDLPDNITCFLCHKLGSCSSCVYILMKIMVVIIIMMMVIGDNNNDNDNYDGDNNDDGDDSDDGDDNDNDGGDGDNNNDEEEEEELYPLLSDVVAEKAAKLKKFILVSYATLIDPRFLTSSV